MDTRAIALTFDYELFLGANHRPAREVLLEPTRALLAALESANAQATFFIDLTYLLRIRELLQQPAGLAPTDLDELKRELTDVQENIVEVCRHGHELALHLHPQWRDAVFEHGLWRFETFKHYALHNLAATERQQLFDNALAVFHELHTMASREPPTVPVFRAGGWCIHPFVQLKDLFAQHGIGVDSSVSVPFFRTPYFYPGPIPKPERALRHKASWRFGDDPLLADSRGAFLEIPIDSVHVGILELLRMQSNAVPMEWQSRGSFIPGPGRRGKLWQRLGKLLQLGEYRMLTLDVSNADAGFSQFQRHAKRFKDKPGFVFMSHPKQFSSQSAAMLKRLADCGHFRFCPMSAYAGSLGS